MRIRWRWQRLSLIHIYSEGLVMSLRRQVDGKAVMSVIGQLGKCSLMVAGHEQMIQILADCLSVLYCAQGLR